MSEFCHALVTGASSGLGRGLALALARRGTLVTVAARRQTELDQLVAEIASAGGQARALPLDLMDDQDVLRQIAALDAEQPIDLCIANAGVGAHTPGTAFDWQLARRIMLTNYVGAAASLAAVLPGMVARRRGHLVGISSVAAFSPLAKLSSYASSKAGLQSFCESLRLDLLDSDVGMTTVCPGFIRTPMTAKNKNSMPFAVEVDEAVARIVAAIDLRQPSCDFPLPVVWGTRLMGLLPRGLFDRVSRRTADIGS